MPSTKSEEGKVCSIAFRRILTLFLPKIELIRHGKQKIKATAYAVESISSKNIQTTHFKNAILLVITEKLLSFSSSFPFLEDITDQYFSTIRARSAILF